MCLQFANHWLYTCGPASFKLYEPVTVLPDEQTKLRDRVVYLKAQLLCSRWDLVLVSIKCLSDGSNAYSLWIGHQRHNPYREKYPTLWSHSFKNNRVRVEPCPGLHRSHASGPGVPSGAFLSALVEMGKQHQVTEVDRGKTCSGYSIVN